MAAIKHIAIVSQAIMRTTPVNQIQILDTIFGAMIYVTHGEKISR